MIFTENKTPCKCKSNLLDQILNTWQSQTKWSIGIFADIIARCNHESEGAESVTLH